MLGRIFVALPYETPRKLPSAIVEMDSLSTFWAATRIPHQPDDANVLAVVHRFFGGLKLNVLLTQ